MRAFFARLGISAACYRGWRDWRANNNQAPAAEAMTAAEALKAAMQESMRLDPPPKPPAPTPVPRRD